MRHACLVSFCLFLFFQSASAGPIEEGWSLAKQTDGIQVYTRPVPGSPMSEFMGVADVEAPLEVVQEVYLDFPSYTQWYGMCREFRKVKDFNDKPNHYIVYYVLKSPWPVKDRDMAVEILTDNLVSQGKVVINMKAVQDAAVPPNNKCVRVTKMTGRTTLTKVNDRTTHIVYQVNSDPAGSVPVRLAQMVAKDQPLKTIQGLREMVKKDIYYTKAGMKK